MPRICPPLALIAAAALAVPIAAPALAAWPHDPVVNVAASIAANTQDSPVSCSDGAGGVFLAWRDSRFGDHDIFAQHLTAAGAVAPGWASNGNGICIVGTDQNRPCIVADGAGGVIIAWEDGRNSNFDIYAQRVNASGTNLWPSGGVRLSTTLKDEDHPVITTDGLGGAIVAWELIYSISDVDIYVNRVDAAGSIASGWSAGGLALISTGFDEAEPCIASDDAGGAIIAWIDGRHGTSNYDIYSMRVTGAGATAVGWTSGGVELCGATGGQLHPGIIADGAGGAIAYWEDRRGADYDVYAARVNWLGTIAFGWTGNGAKVVARAANQYQMVAASDGAGGALFAWSDQRIDGGDIYAQHLTGAGGLPGGWPADGLALCTEASYEVFPRIAADGSGGAIVCWVDERVGGDLNIYAGRVTGSGAIPAAWPLNGVAVCTAAESQDDLVLVSDQTGGAIAAWTDLRNDFYSDIYAQRIEHFGPLGNPEPSIASIGDVKADQGGQVLLKWNASYLDADPDYAVGAYWIWRQVPATVAARAVKAGARWAEDEGAGEVVAELGRSEAAAPALGAAIEPGPGLLFMRGAGTDAASAYAWEYLAAQPASGFPLYSYVTQTAADSVSGHNPYTLWMVQARAASGVAFWNSAADSGYSVDNLPPLPPAPFAGAYSSGTTALHWGVSLEGDFASYRLYRGSSSGFVPGPGSLIAEKPDTGFVDSGPAGRWYKLSAVDAHGNESAFAILAPSGTVDAPGIMPPRELALEFLSANPAAGRARLGIALPRGAYVRLVLFDAGGRMVSVLARGAMPPGEHVVEWDGRDRAGALAPAGIYFARLEAEGRTLTRRVVRMR